MIYVNQAQKPRPSLVKRSVSHNKPPAPPSPPPSRQDVIMKKSCEDLRSKIKNFNQAKRANIILFGPSGSGKSSLIRTFFTSLQQSQVVPKDLCIKNLLHNEGT